MIGLQPFKKTIEQTKEQYPNPKNNSTCYTIKTITSLRELSHYYLKMMPTCLAPFLNEYFGFVTRPQNNLSSSNIHSLLGLIHITKIHVMNYGQLSLFINFQILMSVLWNLIPATITPIVSTLLVHTAAIASRDLLGMVKIVQVCLCEDIIKTLSTYQAMILKKLNCVLIEE